MTRSSRVAQQLQQQQQLPKTFSALQMSETPNPLEEVDGTSSKTTMEASTGEEKGEVKAMYKNLARGGQMEEVQWVDPAMAANTNPLDMSWWAYLLFGMPFMLLANDAFHFLPEDGPLAFLANL
jgi:hypothetical protein